MAAGLSIVTAAFLVLAAGIKLGPAFITLLTFLIGLALDRRCPLRRPWSNGLPGKSASVLVPQPYHSAAPLEA